MFRYDSYWGEMFPPLTPCVSNSCNGHQQVDYSTFWSYIRFDRGLSHESRRVISFIFYVILVLTLSTSVGGYKNFRNTEKLYLFSTPSRSNDLDGKSFYDFPQEVQLYFPTIWSLYFGILLYFERLFPIIHVFIS